MLQSTASIDIKSHKKVAFELLTRPAARLIWQRRLQRAVLLEGDAGCVGAITALLFDEGPEQRRLLETILETDRNSQLHVFQVIGEDELHWHYRFENKRKGYVSLRLRIELIAGSTLGTMRGMFDKRLKSMATDHLAELNEYVEQQNFRRKARRAKRRAVAAAAN